MQELQGFINSQTPLGHFIYSLHDSVLASLEPRRSTRNKRQGLNRQSMVNLARFARSVVKMRLRKYFSTTVILANSEVRPKIFWYSLALVIYVIFRHRVEWSNKSNTQISILLVDGVTS